MSRMGSGNATRRLVGKGAETGLVRVARARAEELIDLVVRRKARITEDFYDIGTALVGLAKKAHYGALG